LALAHLGKLGIIDPSESALPSPLLEPETRTRIRSELVLMLLDFEPPEICRQCRDATGIDSESAKRRISIWNLGTPISSVGRTISNKIFDIEVFDIEITSISKKFTIDIVCRYRTCTISRVTFLDIEGHEKTNRYRIFVFFDIDQNNFDIVL
jgi:hypothetical protein